MLQEMTSLQGDQPEALNAMLAWWNLPRNHKDYYNCILSAPAGTGKTYLTKYFTKYLETAAPLFTATTNEAVRQLELAGIASAKTSHSALGLAPSTTQEKMVFIQKELPDLSDFNLLIVDECSMASMADNEEEELLLINFILAAGMRVLWLGDAYQLPPIESKTGVSPIFSLGFYTVTLSKIIRNQGAILEFCTAVRTVIDKPIKRLPAIPKGVDSIDLSTFSRVITTPEFLEGVKAGTTRVIVWRNETAETINSWIRSNLFYDLPKPLSRFIITDLILFTTPMFAGEYPDSPDKLVDWKHLKLYASINTKAEVLKVELSELYKMPCYKCLLRIEGGGQETAYIPTEEGEARLRNIKKKVVTSTKSMSPRQRAEQWRKWHAFANVFTYVKHAYAMTTHRSQGSTIETVYVHIRDIMCNASRNTLLTYKMVYTACSRAKVKLTLIR